MTRVFITQNSQIRMPSHIPSARREFVVNAAHHSAFQLIKPAPGYSKVQAARDIRAAFQRNGDVRAIRRVERNMRFLGGVSEGPRHTGHLWRVMHSGKMWAVETNADATARRILTVHVGERRVDAAPLQGIPEVRAVRAIRWAHMPRKIPRQGMLTFTNDSSDNHLLVMIKLLPGKSIGDFRRWVNQGAQTRPPLGSHQFSFGVLSPNSTMTGTYSQPQGHYVLLCFWPDADNHGLPHFLMGMYRGVTVT